MAHRRKAGRKRKHGPRTPSGQRSRAWQTVARDLGTLELQAKRKAAVGDNGDPILSTTAIETLCTRGYLADEPELARERCEAGLRYRKLRTAVYGSPWPSNVAGHDASEDNIERAQRRFAALVGFWVPVAEWCPALEPEVRFRNGQLTRDQTVIIEQVCVFDVWPNWAVAQRTGLKILPEDIEQRRLLITGLDAIRGEKTTAVSNAA